MNHSIDELTKNALALPAAGRARLAQVLWESLAGSQPEDISEEDRQALCEAKRRDAEISENGVVERSHEQVMKEARSRSR